MLNPVHLRTLREVVRQGSFVGAANRLGYTPSAVSQQMASLESEVGMELFDRSARSVRPNASAVLMAQHAAAVLAGLEAMMSAATASQGRRDTARISMFPSLAARLMPLLLSDPQLASAGIELTVSVHDPSLAIQELRTHANVDVALVYRMGGTGLSWPVSYRPEDLVSDRFVVIAPTRWELRADVPMGVGQLADRPWIMHHSASSDAEVADDLFAAQGVRPRVAGRSDDYTATIALVAAGMGAAFVPDVVARHLPAGATVLEVDDLPMQRDIFALTATTSPSHRVETLMSAIRAALPTLGYAPAQPSSPPIAASRASSSAWIADSMSGSSAPSIT